MKDKEGEEAMKMELKEFGSLKEGLTYPEVESVFMIEFPTDHKEQFEEFNQWMMKLKQRGGSHDDTLIAFRWDVERFIQGKQAEVSKTRKMQEIAGEGD